MQKQFPLSERLWLDWLEDELKDAAKPKAQPAITAVFELAVQDYLSVAIWAKYLECAITLPPCGSRNPRGKHHVGPAAVMSMRHSPVPLWPTPTFALQVPARSWQRCPGDVCRWA